MSNNTPPQDFVDRHLHMEMPLSPVPVDFIKKTNPDYTNIVRFDIANVDKAQIIERMVDDNFKRGLIAEIYSLNTALRDEQLEARTDSLTGIGNRRSFVEEFERIVAEGHDLDVTFVDFDDFKGVNSDHGHAGGDSALRSVAINLTKVLRKGESVFRFGGDEFIVLRDLTVSTKDRREIDKAHAGDFIRAEEPRRKNHSGDPADIERLVKRITEAFAETDEAFKKRRSIDPNSKQIISATTGHATYESGDTIETLVNRAGLEMQSSKPDRRTDA